MLGHFETFFIKPSAVLGTCPPFYSTWNPTDTDCLDKIWSHNPVIISSGVKLICFFSGLRVRSLVVSTCAWNQRFPVRVRLQAMRRDEISEVIARLMFKSLRSACKWCRRVKMITSLFPYCPDNRECSWKKIQTSGRNLRFSNLMRFGTMLYFETPCMMMKTK